MSVQILISGSTLLSDTFWKGLSGFWKLIKKKAHKVNSKFDVDVFESTRINFTFLGYLAFLTLGFMLCATLQELLGPSANILFHY